MPANLKKFTVVLFGKTGNGKSSTGNTLLGKKKFDAGFSTKGITEEIQRETCRTTIEHGDVEMEVVDTPAMFERGKFEENVLKLFDIEARNPDVFLLVLHGGVRFTEEEQLTVDLMKMIFGENVFQYTIIIVTHGDNFASNELFNKFLTDSEDVRKLMELCGQRVLKIENPTENFEWAKFFNFTDEITGMPYKNTHSNILRDTLITYFQQNRKRKTLRTQLKEIRQQIAEQLPSWRRALLIGGAVVVCGVLLCAYLVPAAGPTAGLAVATSTAKQSATARVIAQSPARAPVQTQAFKK